MGRRMAAIDWAQTPLGPVAGWPQSLRTCVRVVLTSRQPMFVWWGEELINLYNDAYVAIVGGKHPEALGHLLQPLRPGQIGQVDVDERVDDAVRPCTHPRVPALPKKAGSIAVPSVRSRSVRTMACSRANIMK